MTASLISGGTETYTYNAAGQRVMKTDGTNTIEFTYDKEGRQIEETRTAPYFDVLDDQVYAGGRHLVTYTGSLSESSVPFEAIFDHADWQGTSRAKTLYNGNGYENCVNLPYGDGQVCNTAPTDPDPLHYTGKPRDTETGLDYFGARYYSSSMGHWMSPDWAGKPAAVPYANYGDPQSLNLYAMVTGNPISRQDSDGHIMSSPYDAGSLWGGGGSGPQGCLANESADARGICGGESEQVLPAQQTPQAQQPQTVSSEGQQFIKDYEKLRLSPYHDGDATNVTIGYGHKVEPGETFTKLSLEQADSLFQTDLAKTTAALNIKLNAPVSQNEFDALASLQWNLGPSRTTAPVRDLNLNLVVTETDFTKYDKSGGQVLSGLTVRREQEWNIFSGGIYDSSH